MNELIKEILQTYGPAAIPWIIVAACAWFLWKERPSTNAVVQPYHDFMNSYRELVDTCNEAIRENTKVIERLSILIEERTRRQDEWRERYDRRKKEPD